MAQLSKKPDHERRLGCANCLSIDRTNKRCLKCGEQITLYEIQSATPIVSKKWSCSLCTYENSAARNTCEMCGNMRPKQPIIMPTLKYEKQTPSYASAPFASTKQIPEKSSVVSLASKKPTPSDASAPFAPTKQIPEKSSVVSLASKKPTPSDASAPFAPTKQIPEKSSVVSFAAASASASADEWECGQCTFRNRKKKDKCEICEVKNPMFIQEEKQCSNCTLYNPKSIKKCLGCGENKFGEIPVEPTWFCFECEEPNINNNTPRCSNCGIPRAEIINHIDFFKEKIDKIGFFKQDTAMGCMRQAINNVEQKFAVVNHGSFEEKNLEEEVSQLNIKAFCDIISAKIDSQTDLEGEITCDKSENYEYNFLNKIL